MKENIFVTFLITGTLEFRKVLKHEAHSFLLKQQMQLTAMLKYFLERKILRGIISLDSSIPHFTLPPP